MIDFGLAGTFQGKLSLFHRYMNGHGGPPVDASERFLKFAAECELMAKFTPSRANKTVWRRMAERWIRCAEFIERQDSLVHTAGLTKRHRRSARSEVTID